MRTSASVQATSSERSFISQFRKAIGLAILLGVIAAVSTARATVLSNPAITANATPFSGSFPASNVFDGNINEYSSASQGTGTPLSTTPSNGTWIQFDFGAPTTIDGFVNQTRQNSSDVINSSRLIFSSSPTFTAGNPTAVFNPTGSNGQGVINRFGAQTARYVRWEVSSSTGGSNLGSQEMFFLNTPATMKALPNPTIIGGSPAFSGTYALANAANGIVGRDVAGYEYASAGLGAGMFVDFDFGSVQHVGAFDYFNRTTPGSRVTSFNLIFADNPAFASPIQTSSFSGTGGIAFSSSSFTPVFARYVRFLSTGAAGTNVGVNDIIFYSSPVPEPSTMMLLGLGLGGLWMAFRRRRAKTSAALKCGLIAALGAGLAMQNAQATVLTNPSITSSANPFSGSFVAANVFDGSNNEYSSASQGTGTPLSTAANNGTWIQFDFGVPTTIDGFINQTRQNSSDVINSSRLIFSQTGTFTGGDPTAVFNPTGSNGQGTINRFPAQTARYVRWEVSSSSGGNNLGSQEMFFLQKGGAVILPNPTVIGGSPAFNGTYAQANAANGIVGRDVAGYEYASAGAGAGMFLDFDFGSPQSFHAFDFFNRGAGDRVTSLNLIFANSPTFASPLQTTSFSGTGSPGFSGLIPDVTARYVRFQTTGGSGNSGIRDIIFYSNVPEPSTIMLFGLGLGSLWLGFNRRARRKC